MKLRIAVNRITWGMIRATTAISLAMSWAVSIPAQSALAATERSPGIARLVRSGFGHDGRVASDGQWLLHCLDR